MRVQKDQDSATAMLDQFFDHAMRSMGIQPFRRRLLQRDGTWMPDIDIIERDGKLIVRADLPGMMKEDIKVAVEDDMLIIRGSRKEEQEVKKKDYYHAERASGAFYRSVRLPAHVAAEAVDAAYRDGVLEVTVKLPLPTHPNGKDVPVK